MRLGRVYIEFSYVVDLDNQDMVDHAVESIHDDIMNYGKYNEGLAVNTEEKPDLTESDIPSFLTEGLDDE